jgi:hypothetical protein
MQRLYVESDIDSWPADFNVTVSLIEGCRNRVTTKRGGAKVSCTLRRPWVRFLLEASWNASD